MKQQQSPLKVMSGLLMVGQLGISLIVPILLCTFLGVYLSERWQTGPWLVIVAVLVGCVTAGCTFYRTARGFLARENPESSQDPKEKPGETPDGSAAPDKTPGTNPEKTHEKSQQERGKRP